MERHNVELKITHEESNGITYNFNDAVITSYDINTNQSMSSVQLLGEGNRMEIPIRQNIEVSFTMSIPPDKMSIFYDAFDTVDENGETNDLLNALNNALGEEK